MIAPISRKKSEPRRTGLTTEELWHSDDRGITICWEVGRDLAGSEPGLAERALRGELPVLAWKGGVEKKLEKSEKYGTFQYLATWQGLRNEDLNINPTIETELTCSRTGVKVIYTPDSKKYSPP